MVTESSTPIAHRSMEPFETPPVGLAYATPGHQVTPPKRMLAAVVALAVGLLLLLLASFILLRLVSLLMVGAWPGATGRSSWRLPASLAASAPSSAIFLFVGLRWLGGSSARGCLSEVACP